MSKHFNPEHETASSSAAKKFKSSREIFGNGSSDLKKYESEASSSEEDQLFDYKYNDNSETQVDVVDFSTLLATTIPKISKFGLTEKDVDSVQMINDAGKSQLKSAFAKQEADKTITKSEEQLIWIFLYEKLGCGIKGANFLYFPSNRIRTFGVNINDTYCDLLYVKNVTDANGDTAQKKERLKGNTLVIPNVTCVHINGKSLSGSYDTLNFVIQSELMNSKATIAESWYLVKNAPTSFYGSNGSKVKKPENGAMGTLICTTQYYKKSEKKYRENHHINVYISDVFFVAYRPALKE